MPLDRRTECLLAVARSSEAKPLIAHFRLKKNMETDRAEIFSGDGVSLIITGSGKVRSAASVGAFFGGLAYLDNFVALNVGLAFGRDIEVARGTACLIHKIADASTDREFFPDMWFSSPIHETSLTTVDQFPIFGESPTPHRSSSIVDLEASGFFEAASMFLPPHRIGCIKILTQGMETQPNAKDTESLIRDGALAVASAIAAYRTISTIAPPRLTQSDVEWIRAAAQKLQLTVQQRVQLTEWTAQYCEKNNGRLPSIADFPAAPYAGKQERNRHLVELKKRLLASG